MSNVFASGFGNLGANAVARASEQANKYNQELTKREMVSQTEESLGGMKLFTSGRELFGKTLKDSKIKQYASQQFKKALKKAGGNEDDAVQTAASKEAASATKTAATKSAESEIQETAFGNNAAGASDSQNVQETAAIKERARLKANEGEDEEGGSGEGGGKGKGGEDDEEEGLEEGADAGEGAEIGGLEAASSVLDAIPGVDLIGAVLGAVGLVAGFTKKPPHQITNPISNTSYSTQLGLDA